MQWSYCIIRGMETNTSPADSINVNSHAGVHEAAEIVGVSPDTIRRWEKKGLVKAERSRRNYRLFKLEELRRIQAKYSGKAGGAKYTILKGEKTGNSVIELFSGCGGMALGFENAGLSTELLVEIDGNCVETLRANRPGWKVVQADINDVDFTEYKDKVDIVAGGFPCQTFSYAGNSSGFLDTRGTLFFQFARCVKEVLPKIAVAENVRGLVRHDAGRTLATMLNTLGELGYYVDYQLLRSQFLDVPQKRERLFILGIRKDLDIKFAYPKEGDYTVSIREALEGCPSSAFASYPARKREIMEMVPPGGYWRDLPLEVQREYMKGSFHLSGGKTGMARRLSWEEPSLTLTTSPAQKHTERCHPAETRPLSVREYARIQCFPDEWRFAGSATSQYRQIGNAVPVNLAFHMGRCIIAMLGGKYDESTMLVRGRPKEAYRQLGLSLEV